VATNLSDIGFHVSQSGDMETLASKFFASGKCICFGEGSYLLFEAGNGVELWGQLNANEELIGFNPHFSGKTKTSAGIMERVTRAGFPMDGGFKCLAQPFGADPIKGAFPFIFDTPDFLLSAHETLPAIRTIQLSAFAQQCGLFLNEEDFRARSARSGSKLHSDAFVPLGMIDEQRQPRPEPLATAVIIAHILDVSETTNPATSHKFWWLKVRNSVGEIDVVADPELLPHGAKPGNIIQCSAWLSGRLSS
jgi:hypothetical protein